MAPTPKEPATKKARLELPDIAPTKPVAPGIGDTDFGKKAEAYLNDLGPWARFLVTTQMAKPESEGGFALTVPLHEVAPLMISSNAEKKLTTFRECWNAENCKAALQSTGLYEAAGNIWWFSNHVGTWAGEPLVGAEVSWTQFQAARAFWSTDAFNSSAENAAMRRYIFHGSLPSAISGLPDAERKSKGGGTVFQDLPLLAGRAVVLSYKEAFVKAIEEKDFKKVLKLYEAGLSTPIRLRSGPTPSEIMVDSLSWAESVRVQAAAGADSVLSFIQKLACIPSVRVACETTVKALESELTRIGIRFNGKQIQKSGATAIAAIAPFAAIGAVRSAFTNLENVTSALNEQTKLMRLCQTVGKRFPNFGDASRAVVFCINCLEAAVCHGECSEADINVPFLVGQKSQAAFVHMCCKKLQFIDYIAASNRAHTDISDMKTICDEVRDHVIPHFRDPRAMMAKLEVHGWAVSPEVLDGTPQGIASKTATKYQEYRKSLTTPAAACLADVLHGVLSDQFNEEFLALSQHELSTTAHNTSFADYLAKRSDDKDDGDDSPLRHVYAAYVESCYAKPTAVATEPGVAGEEPAPMDAFGAAIDEEQQQERERVWKAICEKRRQLVNFLSPRTSGGVPKNVSTKQFLQSLWAGSKTLSALADCKKKPVCRCFLLSAELFATPNPKATSACCLDHKGIAQPTEEFGHALEWVASVRQSQDVILVFDGRSKAIRRVIEDWLQEKMCSDPDRNVDAWIIFSTEKVRGDQRFPKRKVAFGGVNRETMHACLPTCRTNMKAQPRDSFKLCGEKSTHELTYSGVSVKTLVELPRLSSSDKQQITGREEKVADELLDEIGARGVPLFWGDWLPIQFYAGVFRDFGVTDVFDLSSGQGGAAVGAYYANVNYEGVCINEQHETWLNRLLDRAVAGVLSEQEGKKGDKGDDDFTRKIKQYFSGTVSEARRLLRPARTIGDEDDVDLGVASDSSAGE